MINGGEHMKTINSAMNKLFTHQEREEDTCRPPPMKVVAHDLGVPLLTFRNWYHTFQLRTGAPDWHSQTEGHLTAFYDYLDCIDAASYRRAGLTRE